MSGKCLPEPIRTAWIGPLWSNVQTRTGPLTEGLVEAVCAQAAPQRALLRCLVHGWWRGLRAPTVSATGTVTGEGAILRQSPTRWHSQPGDLVTALQSLKKGRLRGCHGEGREDEAVVPGASSALRIPPPKRAWHLQRRGVTLPRKSLAGSAPDSWAAQDVTVCRLPSKQLGRRGQESPG